MTFTNFQLLRQSAHLRQVPILSPATEVFLGDLLEQQRSVRCLEIGSAIGYSSMLIAEKVAQRSGNLISFEISLPAYKEGLYHTAIFKKKNLTVFPFDITKVPLQKILTSKLDFVFVDGRKSEYGLYLQLIEPWLAPGAVLIFDDCIKYASQMQDFFAFLCDRSETYRREQIQLDEDDGVVKVIRL